MLIREHALEKYWLERRLELLDILDDLARESLNDDDFNMSKDDARILVLRKHYADVIEPYTLSETIKKIYPSHLYGTPKSQ
jgi:hypothetical protein